ncbi:MAG: AAA family ATPase [Acidobacteria bacterium]|nr:AAA family ATPase [Acidobacteriota bacterium]
MLNRLQLLRNIGQFDSVPAGAQMPLLRNVLIYAENGRGKTTLTAILRSLRSGDPVTVLERRRLSAANPPHVVIDCTGGPPAATFQNGAWNRTYPHMEIFDDQFVDENVCSGLDVASAHRQNLHELILGAQGVTLHSRVTAAVEAIETVNGRIRNAANAIPANERHGLTVDDFCNLPNRADIEDAILAEERLFAASRQSESIRATALFEPFRLPEIDVERIEAVLGRDLAALETGALAGVQERIATLGPRREQWIATGMSFVSETGQDDCPFCEQPLSTSPVIESYRGYFSEEYARLKAEIAELLRLLERQHGGDARAAFERSVRVAQERKQFWQEFISTPEFGFDTVAVANTWRTAYDQLRTLVEQKQAAPLEPVTLPEDLRGSIRDHVTNARMSHDLDPQITEANAQIALVRERLGTTDGRAIETNLARLRATRSRHSQAMTPLCDEYIAAKAAKETAENERDAAKAALDQYRNTVFPGYQTAINLYLGRLNAGFRVDRVVSTDTRGGPTCNYSLVVNNTQVPVAGNAQNHGPSFRTALSAGDRNTLALAFFFAALDQNPNLAQSVVVIDDPLSSLDDHRILATTQELRRLGQRAAQLVVLSHNKPFLCRLWEGMDRQIRTALKIERDGAGSTLSVWSVDADSITEHDRRHVLLTEYLVHGPRGNEREVARSLRPHLEAYLRVTCPEHFPPGTMLGPFHGLCQARYGLVNQILDRPQIDELHDIKEFANRYHHENPAWETEIINDAELAGFVNRTLAFTRA